MMLLVFSILLVLNLQGLVAAGSIHRK